MFAPPSHQEKQTATFPLVCGANFRLFFRLYKPARRHPIRQKIYFFRFQQVMRKHLRIRGQEMQTVYKSLINSRFKNETGKENAPHNLPAIDLAVPIYQERSLFSYFSII
ncbi:MAG TPA: hypothetical protein DIW30_07880 [Bacteroidales bacterium]|nr:hypothetical protein [Bacteroidales bacterium]